MSIYFFHAFAVLLPLFCIASLASVRIKRFGFVFLWVFLAFMFAYFAFYIASAYARTQGLAFFAYILLFSTLILFILSFFKKELLSLRLIFIFFTAFAFGVRYYVLSQDFPIFTSSLLDSEAIKSLAFIILALVLALIFFFFLRWQFKFNQSLSFIFFAFVLGCELNTALANIFHTAMRQDLIYTYSPLLSYVAKSVYYAQFFVYMYLIFLLVLAFLLLRFKVFELKKEHLFDMRYRQIKALNTKLNAYFGVSFASFILAFGMILYFHVIYLRPVSIDAATQVVPNENAEFIFDMALLRDNKLHRFAYISSEGKVIRFFLINKREDRDAPVAVFDACAICGDMGYVQRGNELICISCNVRIFLPSVGKEGGCNPIPLAYKFDGEKISIKLEDVIKGSKFFTEVKELEVQDPVSKTKLINLKARYFYIYAGLTYYFDSEENYEAFKNDPEKYLDHNLSAVFKTQG
ncbi:Fe-S-containing protein [Campylobacter sp. MIT 97-5078]|uniref:Fe-S-containing protein n=1 Tax=Campylobacter sp. MIT 97-5078 TaxID=1548153 RepID=UPI000512E919|nr:Fe-S-containing protein [Campylobacter sp. MIT 97-5078]KGI56112.1 membrane protein [Campylobacter sp. MIT 97-5078]KGI57107.1 membrane protein [Campylobacter sp. MIT 97-5078]TQR25473.1 DUF2318 domain-containing protein [Campylobacter sp. MIT 97-5078]